MLGNLCALLFNGIIGAFFIGTAIPGPHRIIAPESFGMTEIAPRIWTDAPSRKEEFLSLITTAKSQVGAFFGDAPVDPNLILCATQSCAAGFGIGGNGLSISRVAVMVSPGGLTLGTLSHELTHARLHRRMGLRNLVKQPYPTWFDEGLATHVASHPIWPGQISNAHRTRIRKVEHVWQLDDAFRDLGVGRTYLTAASEVANIEAIVGRSGLLELIARAKMGEDFFAVLNELQTR